MVSTPPEPDSGTHQVTGVDAGRAMHRARPRTNPVRLTAALVGAAAIAAGIGVGTAALLRSPDPVDSTPSSARHITATPRIPLSDAEVLALLRQPPDYGRLHNPARRTSCLAGLGYDASTRVLGARPVEVEGRDGVLLVLPGDDAAAVIAVAVEPNCSEADTGLLADTTLARPVEPAPG